MRYRKNAKLDTSQIKDLRVYGAVKRRSANEIPDGADKPPSPENVAAEIDYRRYHHITYSQAYQPVGHSRGYGAVKVRRKGRDHYVVKADRPDGADRVKQPKLRVKKPKRPARGIR